MFAKLVLALFIAAAPGLDKKEDLRIKDLSNWEVLSGNWKVVDGGINGNSGGGDGLILFKGPFLKNFTLECKISVENREGSLAFRVSDKNNMYLLVLSPKTDEESQGSILLIRRVKGKETYFAGAEQYFKIKEFVKIKIVCDGNKIDAYVNDKFAVSVEDANLPSGLAGLRVYGDFFNGAAASFKDFSVKETEVKK